jgi:hypothetical protein
VTDPTDPTDEIMRAAYEHAYLMLRRTSSLLETLKKEGTGGHGVEPHAGAAMWAVRLAEAVLFPMVRGGEVPPPYTGDTDWLLNLAACWRDAAFDLGEYALPPPVLRVVKDGDLA